MVEIKKGGYVCIQEWMLNLGLNPTELMCLAVIFGFSQDGRGRYKGSAAYLAHWCCVKSKKTIFDALKKLVEKGIIIKYEREDSGVKFCDYAYNFEVGQNLQGVDKNYTTPSVNSISGGSVNFTPHNIDIDNIKEIFLGLGYEIADGPEIEKTYYVFDQLNTPIDHPARDLQDTFYINDEVVLRSQTSSVQIRVMEKQKPPIKIICPGTVYRSDSVDPTHSPVFHQIEGLVVGKNISLSDLKGTLELLVRKMFGKDRNIRFRASYFPFTEPSYEVDVSCFNCNNKGCNICKHTGWIEILGSGMVHPNVLRDCGFDPEVYTGFAFGLGIERVAMLKYGINNIRLFYSNDERFLNIFDREEI